jgi:peptidoglycan/xylan/chitin deacetylase (PgdA/CDA1 family)
MGFPGLTRVQADKRYAPSRVPQLLPQPRPAQPLVVFSFDDCPGLDFSQVKPILDAAGIKGCFPIITARIGTTGHMTWDQVRALRDQGHEINAHTRNHVSLRGVTTAQLQDDIDGSIADLIAEGIEPAGFCWPFATFDGMSYLYAQQRANFGLGAQQGSGYNSQPQQTWGLYRQSFLVGNTLSQYTTYIDTAVANNEVLVFLFHAAMMDDTQFALLPQVIAYAQSKPVPIVTTSEALALTGNLIDTGDPYTPSTYFQMGGNGVVKSNGSIIAAGTPNPSPTDPPSAYTAGFLTYTTVNGADEAGWPNSLPGWLLTDRLNTAGGAAFTRQIYMDNLGDQFVRIASDVSTWGSWITLGAAVFIIGAANPTFSSNTPSLYTNGKITSQSVNGSSATGWPEGVGGNVLTDASNGASSYQFIRQEYTTFTGNKYVRFATSTTTWGNWVNASVTIGLSVSSLAVPSTIAPGITMKMVTASGPSSGGAGTLISYNPNAAGGTNYTNIVQEFHDTASNAIWKRRATGASAWSAWQSVNLT